MNNHSDSKENKATPIEASQEIIKNENTLNGNNLEEIFIGSCGNSCLTCKLTNCDNK